MLRRTIVLVLSAGLLMGGASRWLLGDVADPAGEVILPGLHAEASVGTDALGVPDIRAGSREDAMRVLGYLHARDRLFQMDLMRRKSAGRLAEVFGEAALESDRAQRVFGFEGVARAVKARLPEAQARLLTAYAKGVNTSLTHRRLPPPECLALGYSPEPWREEDSLLVALGMFQTLNGQEQGERMLTVMTRALPPELVAFLTPDTSEYTTTLLGGPGSRRPVRPLPLDQWRKLVTATEGLTVAGADSVDPDAVIAGSNNWAVAGSRTRDGRAILANDMHLPLGVPNVWYRAVLRYADKTMAGVTLPGLPMLVAGSNGRVAWGYTNIDADLLDLVALESNPSNPEAQYRTPGGWQDYARRMERIRVKGGADVLMELKSTIWGPVAPAPLLGQPVAIRWMALDADAVDLGLVEMDRAKTLEQALDVLNDTGAPPQNVVLADDAGRIGWTYMGRFPRRVGFDGAVSRGWADGTMGWDGHIPPRELPRLLDPPAGYLATANNRTLGKEYPHVIGHDYANAYRAYRIGERLRALRTAGEVDMLAVQLDTRSEPFDFYRDLALEVLDEKAAREPLLGEARAAIAAWNGSMDADSLGMPLLSRFRKKLAEAVFAPVVARARQLDPNFNYAWREMETPLRALVRARDDRSLPDRGYGDWRELLLRVLRDSAEELRRRYPDVALSRLPWGRVNHIVIRHPMSRALPPTVAAWLDMEPFDGAGCAGFCVRVLSDPHGATERMVVSPNHPEDAILHMPGGQSGNPWSAHYRDQQAVWREGEYLPFLPGEPRALLRLLPDRE